MARQKKVAGKFNPGKRAILIVVLAVTLALFVTLPQATAVAPLFQTVPESEPLPTIDSFTYNAQDVAGSGKQILFQWETSNVTQARIISGATQFNARWWNVDPDGELQVNLPRTLFHDPDMILIVTDGKGNYASQTLSISWNCEFAYFFQPPAKSCPLQAHSVSQATEQRFENGRLIWVERVALRDEFREDRIYAIYETGPGQSNWVRFDNVPPTDPITPEGCSVPIILGFSRVWQENKDVRLKLGCPLEPENYFDTLWQWQLNESGSAVAYLRTMDNRVIQLYGERLGGWHYQRP